MGALKEPEEHLRRLDSLVLGLHDEVDRPRGLMDLNRPHLVRCHDPESAALDHGWPTHPDRGASDRDHHIAAAQQRSVPGEAATGSDPDERHVPRERSKPREGTGVESGHHCGVGVTRPTPASLGKEDDWQLESIGELKETILLAVVALALGAGEHHVVVRDHDARCRLDSEELRVDRADPTHEAISRRLSDQLSLASTLSLRRIGESPVLDEAPRVDEIGQVLARGAEPRRSPPRHTFGPGVVVQQCFSGSQLGEAVDALVRDDGLSAIVLASSHELDQDRADLHPVAMCDQVSHDDDIDLGGHQVLHLHRLQHADRPASRDPLAERRQPDHRRHHRRAHVPCFSAHVGTIAKSVVNEP